MKPIRLFLAALLTLFVSGCASNPAKITADHGDGYQQMRTDLDKNIPRLIKKNDLASMVVLVLDDQDVVYAKGFGYADLENKIEASPDIAYRIGSISKLFTATAIMQLQEQGKLEIDKPLRDYLPEFSINTPYGLDSITLRGMLTHYSGLPSDFDKGFSSYAAAKGLISDLQKEHVVFEPNTVHAYSNLAYGLLGIVIERVSGLSLGAYLNENIFAPLAMKNASLGNSDSAAFARAYKSYELKSAVEIRDRAAGDIRMSANDLALFAKSMMHYIDGQSEGGSLPLSQGSVDSMWSTQDAGSALGGGFDMGLGWLLSYPSKSLAKVPGLVWHNGSTFFYNSAMLMSTEEKLAVIVLVNSDEGENHVSGEVAENTLLASMFSKSGYKPQKQKSSSNSIDRFTPQQVEFLRGRYLSNIFGEFTIDGNDKKLSVKVMGQKVLLVPMEDEIFGIKLRLFGFIPYTNSDIKDLRLQALEHDGQQVIRVVNGPALAQKVNARALPEYMKQYLGQYHLANPDQLHEDHGLKNMVLSNAGGYIRSEVELEKDTQTFFLEVLSEHRAKVIGFGRGQGGSAFFSVNAEGQPVVRYSGLEFAKAP